MFRAAKPSSFDVPHSMLNVRRSPRFKLDHFLTHLALILICAGFLIPFIWMLSTSLKPLDQTMEYPPRVIPRTVKLSNYLEVHEKLPFIQYTRNTLIIAILCVAGTVISSSLVAYGFARVNFKGRSALFVLMLSTMMIPFPVLMVSLFSIWRFIGDHTPFQMLGTFRPLWLPAFFGSAFNIFLLRQFFLTIPEELSEAARIDGCSELAIFLRIILPLAKPALTVVALFTFMAAWNDFLGPLVYLQDPSQYTLALGLQSFQAQHGATTWNLLMAASVMIIAPVVLLFFVAQKTFIQGIATTGLKG
jgi:multiple sugar transport system permease protein